MEKQPNYQSFLQDKDLELTAQSLPETMREAFIWLGCYLRNECNRNIDVLEREMQNLGFPTVGSTISKVIIGRWKTRKDEDGAIIDLKHPVISEKLFLDIVAHLKSKSHKDAMVGLVPFIETDTWELIKNYIDERRVRGRICKFGLIIGHTGLQKTACLEQYALRNNHGKVVHIEAPETNSMAKFITDLALRYGVGRSKSKAEKELSIHENVNEGKTIIVDNVQRLYKPAQGWTQPMFSFLQKLQDDTKCTVILCTVPDAELLRQGSRGYFEQFEGRCGGPHEFLWLPEFTPWDEILQIVRAFKLKDPEKHRDLLEKIAHGRGRLRILFNVLQLAKQEAEAENSRHLTRAHLDLVLDNQRLNDLRAKKTGLQPFDLPSPSGRGTEGEGHHNRVSHQLIPEVARR